MEHELLLARVIASHASLLVRAVDPVDGHSPTDGREATIELAGRALAVVAEESRSGERIARLALEATACSCVLWRSNGQPEPSRPPGVRRTSPTRPRPCGTRTSCSRETEAGARGRRRARPARRAGRRRPAPRLRPEDEPSADELATLETFGARAAHAVRAGERMSDLTQELERSRRCSRSSGRQSPSCRFRTPRDGGRPGRRPARDRPGAVYLRQAGGLESAAERGLAGPHVRVAEGLDLILKRVRARPVVEVQDATTTLAWGRSEMPSRSRGSKRPSSSRFAPPES